MQSLASVEFPPYRIGGSAQIETSAFPTCFGYGLLNRSHPASIIESYSSGNVTCLPCNNGTLAIPTWVYSVPSWGFSNCTALTQVHISRNLRHVGSLAFSGSGLQSVVIPNATLASGAFKGCQQLTAVSLPRTEHIPDHAFFNCSRLTNVSIPAANSAGSFAFGACTALETIRLPQSLGVIGQSMFAGCSSLGSVGLSQNTSFIGSSAFVGTALQSVQLSDALQLVDKYAFANITTLQSVMLPTGSIQPRAFQNSTVTTFHLGPATRLTQPVFGWGGCPPHLYRSGADICQCSPCVAAVSQRTVAPVAAPSNGAPPTAPIQPVKCEFHCQTSPCGPAVNPLGFSYNFSAGPVLGTNRPYPAIDLSNRGITSLHPNAFECYGADDDYDDSEYDRKPIQHGIILDNNPLGSLPLNGSIFNRAKYISMQNCSITSLPPRAFETYNYTQDPRPPEVNVYFVGPRWVNTIVANIYLGDNLITELPAAAFVGVSSGTSM